MINYLIDILYRLFITSNGTRVDFSIEETGPGVEEQEIKLPLGFTNTINSMRVPK